MLPYKLRLALKVTVLKVFGKATGIMSDETFNKVLFRIMFGRKADFNNPTTFNEFVCARKIRQDAYDLWPYTDKYEVRKYVRDTIGEQYLNENYGVYTKFEDIDVNALPDRFVLRGTHGSGYNIVVRDKTDFEPEKAGAKFQKWLKENYYYRCRERNYFQIKPRITCDRFLECKTAEGLPEMKVFCFGGKAKLISYNIFENSQTYVNMYDENWNYLNVAEGYPHFADKTVPENHAEILRVAEALAAPFDFVRVDLYNIDGRILFSELTFFTGGGFAPFSPLEYDEKFADYFKELDALKKRS